jgi:Cu(I)/Ag(I) efflux system membrane fusion protein
MFGRKLWWILKTVQARLRFLVILLAIGGVISHWDTLNAYYEKWMRVRESDHDHAGGDTEYFCPMHPQIVRDNPKEKCPICFMPLSKRHKGERQAVALPAGTVSRVQLTPYRVVLAGVQTTEVTYQPLSKEITTFGTVEFDERKLARIAARLGGRSRIDKLYVNVTGQTVHKGDPLALLYNAEFVSTVQNLLDAQKQGSRQMIDLNRAKLRLWSIDPDQIDDTLKRGKPITHLTIRSAISGHIIRKYQVEGEYVEEGARLYDVVDLSSVWIQAQVYQEDLAYLKEGLPVRATTPAYPAREPFMGKIAFVQPHLDQATRTLTVRFDMDNSEHELRPGMDATVKIQVPVAQMDLFAEDSTDAEQRNQLRQGRVLAVPESAVIDTGSRKVVYREASPGVYDGVEVQLGPRMVGPREVTFYPVVQGLKVGERVVTIGSFLIDAETRLNPAAGSIYYGGSGSGGVTGSSSSVTRARPSMPADEEAVLKAAVAKLSPEDRTRARAQQFCPILPDRRLGSMGTPVKVLIQGQPVFLCCEACENEAKAKPDQTLAKIRELTTKSKTPKH